MLLRLSYPAVCLASLALITGCKPAATKATFAPPPPAVTVAKPIVKKVIDWDEFTGRLASPESVDIRARVSGYLEEVHFKEGTEVKEGDLLVTIDPRPYEAAVQRAQADVSSARSRAELAKTEAENAGPLLKKPSDLVRRKCASPEGGGGSELGNEGRRGLAESRRAGPGVHPHSFADQWPHQ
jgi:multidrug efflux pump subunit AcrA (membrane-fusion protein)